MQLRFHTNHLNPGTQIPASLMTVLTTDNLIPPVDNDNESNNTDYQIQYLAIIFGACLAIWGVKHLLDRYKLLNTHTFLHQTPIKEINPDKLIVLDHYAFDIDELETYIKSDLTKLYRNPHDYEFSDAAKKIMQNHKVFAGFAVSLKRRLEKQKKSISLATIDNLTTMLLNINESLIQREIEIQESPQIQPADEIEFDLEWLDSSANPEEELESLMAFVSNERPEDPLADFELEQLQSVINHRIAHLPDHREESDGENVPRACEEARLKFTYYMETLSKNQRRCLNNYIIEVPLITGGKQRLKFKDAFIGGSVHEPCLLTLQIFLWQMVVIFKPDALKLVPKPVILTAEKFSLAIKSPHSQPTVIGDFLKYTSSLRNRFFNAVSLNNPLTQALETRPRARSR